MGQNFLKDQNILNKIVDCGNITDTDIVLEIGPGTGNLTEKILEKNPKYLIVVEKDRDLSLLLKKKFGNKINIINKDILNCFNSFKFSEPIKVFGNLPYNISTKILISFLKEDNLNNFFKKFVFIFQKEVADRILAEENSNKYGRLSVLTSWKMNKLKIVDIHPNSFYPIPKVWSTLLTLTPKLKFIKLKKKQKI